MDFDRQKKIAEARAKALERIRDRQKKIKNANRPVPKQPEVPRVAASASRKGAEALTPVQRAIIERNRQRALERRRQVEARNGGRETVGRETVGRETVGCETVGRAQPLAQPDYLDNVRVSRRENLHSEMAQQHHQIRPSVVKGDYIEYDFSTMHDSFGGFLAEDNGGGANGDQPEKSLADWKSEQEDRGALLDVDNGVKAQDAPPPLDIANAAKCLECGSIEVDPKFLKVFHVRVCRRCQEKYPEKYSLLTKTECKEDYFLTEPELADFTLFHRIVKENPHSGTFSRMQLFLRQQIEDYAFKKWGGEENLDKEWLRREEMRKNRREKRFNTKLKEMRRKLRAEEITRKLRSDRVSTKHQHDWSAPVLVDAASHTYKRRCAECGMEVEEMMMN